MPLATERISPLVCRLVCVSVWQRRPARCLGPSGHAGYTHRKCYIATCYWSSPAQVHTWNLNLPRNSVLRDLYSVSPKLPCGGGRGEIMQMRNHGHLSLPLCLPPLPLSTSLHSDSLGPAPGPVRTHHHHRDPSKFLMPEAEVRVPHPLLSTSFKWDYNDCCRNFTDFIAITHRASSWWKAFQHAEDIYHLYHLIGRNLNSIIVELS